jgi:hypothetical protein
VTPLTHSSWSRFFEEFHCRGCGGEEAYRSRPRGFFERHVLRVLMLQAVRCERCYHRSYVLRTITVLKRVPSQRKKTPQSQPPDSAMPGNRVA